jgi:hypothetical protein
LDRHHDVIEGRCLVTALEARLSKLDEALDGGGHDLDALSRAFVSTMCDVSFRRVPDATGTVVDPEIADEAVAGSAFLAALRRSAPWLLDGPSSSECAQHWIATAKPPWLAGSDMMPTQDALLTVVESGGTAASRSARGGLFTSSATPEFPGMWRHYLEQNARSGLWPGPWRTWRLSLAAQPRVVDVTSARDWVGLMEEYPNLEGGDLELNWGAIAADVDAVHITPEAVCGVEGFRMRTARGPSAPVYWDVEGTRWLRWSFDSVELVSDEPTVPLSEE